MWSWKHLGGVMLALGILGGPTLAAGEPQNWDGKIVQYGRMHEAIGQQQHQGRVNLNALVERPHFFGVGALEKLAGEATIYGAYVPSWFEHKILEDVGADEFDQYIADMASQSGINVSEPFVFTIEGEFGDLRLHVINGACPLHARLKKIEIPPRRSKSPGKPASRVESLKLSERVVGDPARAVRLRVQQLVGKQHVASILGAAHINRHPFHAVVDCQHDCSAGIPGGRVRRSAMRHHGKASRRDQRLEQINSWLRGRHGQGTNEAGN